MLLYLLNQRSIYLQYFQMILITGSGDLEKFTQIMDLATSLFVLIFGSGSLVSIIKLFLNYRDNQKIKLISIFSETDEKKRLSGVQEISKYSGILFKELFFICSMEKDELIKEFVFDILEKQSPHSRKQCIIMNNFLLDYCIKHNYRSNDFKHFQINHEMLEILKDSPTDQRILLNLYQNKFPGMSGKINEINNHLLLSSQLLGSAIKKSFLFRLCGNLIAQSDMYASKWICVSMQNCVFIDHISSHMFSFSAKYRDCFFQSGNYCNSKFLMTAFQDCKIQNCIFNSSYFILTKFQKEEPKEAATQNGNRKKQKKFLINNCKWKDCKIIYGTYHKIQFQKNEMIRTCFFSNTYSDVKFFRTKLIGGYKKINSLKIRWVNFKNCSFKNVVWCRSLFIYVQFTGCHFENITFDESTFENITFDGSTFEKVKFIKCHFKNADFNKIKSITESKFQNCSLKNLSRDELKFSDVKFTDCYQEPEDHIDNIQERI